MIKTTFVEGGLNLGQDLPWKVEFPWDLGQPGMELVKGEGSQSGDPKEDAGSSAQVEISGIHVVEAALKFHPTGHNRAIDQAKGGIGQFLLADILKSQCRNCKPGVDPTRQMFFNAALQIHFLNVYSDNNHFQYEP
jgi:hypothetical protein